MKKSVHILFIFFFLVLSFSFVQAIGISPARTDIAFEPNLQQTLKIYLINSGSRPLNATLQFTGDLAQYFTAEEGFFVLDPKSTKVYTVQVQLPEIIKRPGPHSIAVNAIQGPLQTDQPEKGITALISVQGEISVLVPYTGQYAEATLTLQDVNEGEPSTATVEVINYGLEDIQRGQATLEIYSPTHELMDTLTSPVIIIPSRQTDSFTFDLDTKKYGPGIFPVTAYVDYDDARTDPIEKELRIGTLFANVTNYTTSLPTGKITLFEIHLQNRWNNPLQNVYAQAKFFKNGVELPQVLKTPSVDMLPWATATVSAFFDATNLEPGDYTVEITAFYLGKTTVITGPFTLKKPSQITPVMILVLIVILILLIDIFIWILYHRRRDDNA